MWYVVQYKANQGDRARENLTNQGVNCFYPTIPVQRRKSGRRIQSDEALFPGYMFIELSQLDLAWSKIRSTRGVLRIVEFAGKPAEVDSALVCSIHERVGSFLAKPDFEPGQSVRVLDGPFEGLGAIFQSSDGSERALILLNLMQRECRVRISTLSIE